MIVRLKIALDQVEYSALVMAGENELRNPVDQAHHILRQELINIGLLEPNKTKNTKEKSEIKEIHNG
jgi:hypothetical protein